MRTHAKVTKKGVEGGRLGAGYGEIQGTKRKEAGVPVCEERHSPLGSCFTGQLGNHPALYPSRPLPPLARSAFHAGGGQLLSSPRPSPASDP